MLEDKSSLCALSITRFVLLTNSRYTDSQKFCHVHGGSLVMPESDEENHLVLGLLKGHKDTCIDKNYDALGWINANYTPSGYYKLARNRSQIPMSYTNYYFKNIPSFKEMTCSFMMSDGRQEC